MQTASETSPPQDEETRTDLLKRALALGLELEALLEQAAREDKSFRLRLARAQALSTIDALTDLVREETTRAPVPSEKSGVYAISNEDGKLVTKAAVGD
jgi:hypothetical protein